MKGSELITIERQRQIEKEGWTPEHDDNLVCDELAFAAAAYALTDKYFYPSDRCNHVWPWAKEWWKPTPNDRIRELEKAGALIAAEIDRLLRLKSKEAHSD